MINRYSLAPSGLIGKWHMVQHLRGTYVLHDDHLAEIATLKDSLIVWHDPKEKPAGGTTLLLKYRDGYFDTWNHYNNPELWDDFCERHVLVEWAYISPKE